MKQNKRIIALLAAVLVLCTGCSMDVESFLQPPRVGGQQQAVQAALETYLRDSGGSGVRYTLEYPVEGEYTAAFLLCDEQGFPVEDTATAQSALAFYSLSTAPDVTRMNRLQRSGGEWVSVADTVGEGPAIRQVSFGDLDGDGTAEIVTGWSTYTAGSNRLAVYGTAEGLTLIDGTKQYTSLFVGDLTAAGYDSLLLLTVGSGERVTATLETLGDDALRTVDTARLDGAIRQFGTMTLCRLSADVHGLFVDAFKTEGVTITELIYYDDTGLQTPFYDPATNTTAATARVGRTTARDMDGDALVEIPRHTVLAGHTAADVGGTVTLWRGWDYSTRTWLDYAYTLLNEADGYMVVLGDGLHTHLDTAYDTATRTLTLTDTVTVAPFLWLTVGAQAPDSPAEGLELLRLFDTRQGQWGYYAWYDPTVMTAEKVRYTVTRLTGEGG